MNEAKTMWLNLNPDSSNSLPLWMKILRTNPKHGFSPNPEIFEVFLVVGAFMVTFFLSSNHT